MLTSIIYILHIPRSIFILYLLILFSIFLHLIFDFLKIFIISLLNYKFTLSFHIRVKIYKDTRIGVVIQHVSLISWTNIETGVNLVKINIQMVMND